MMILAPSMLAADFKQLGNEIKLIEDNGAKYLHFDVMDGIFVPSISFGMPVLESIRPATNLVCDVHLMITEPIRYIEAFKKATNKPTANIPRHLEIVLLSHTKIYLDA